MSSIQILKVEVTMPQALDLKDLISLYKWVAKQEGEITFISVKNIAYPQGVGQRQMVKRMKERNEKYEQEIEEERKMEEGKK